MTKDANHRNRSFLFAFLASAGLAVSGMAAFNYAVDPFQYYRVAKLFKPVLWGGMQRHQNAGLAGNFSQDTVIVGSSVTENFLPGDVRRLWGKAATKLSISGSTAHEQFLVLRSALKTGRVKNVFWGLDTGAFYFASTAVRDDQAPFPWHMYRDNGAPNIEYLLGLGTTRLSIAALKGYGETNFDAYHAWHDKFEFGPAVTIKAWGGTCASFKQKYVEGQQLPSADLLKKRDASIQQNLVELIRAHPEVKFHLFLPPLATLIYIPAGGGFLPLHLSFRVKLAESVLGFSNVRLFEFQSDPSIAGDLNRFKDPLHFDLKTTQQIIESIHNGNHLIRDIDTMNKKNRDIIKMANEYDICNSGIVVN